MNTFPPVPPALIDWCSCLEDDIARMRDLQTPLGGNFDAVWRKAERSFLEHIPLGYLCLYHIFTEHSKSPVVIAKAINAFFGVNTTPCLIEKLLMPIRTVVRFKYNIEIRKNIQRNENLQENKVWEMMDNFELARMNDFLHQFVVPPADLYISGASDSGASSCSDSDSEVYDSDSESDDEATTPNDDDSAPFTIQLCNCCDHCPHMPIFLPCPFEQLTAQQVDHVMTVFERTRHRDNRRFLKAGGTSRDEDDYRLFVRGLKKAKVHWDSAISVGFEGEFCGCASDIDDESTDEETCGNDEEIYSDEEMYSDDDVELDDV